MFLRSLFIFYLPIIFSNIITIISSYTTIKLKINKEVESKPTLACLMIVRDEAENLQTNLPKWNNNENNGNFFDAYVIGIDDRTKDNSTDIITNYLDSKSIPYHIFYQTFIDFGTSRTKVLEETYKYFSNNITHVFFIDPDWSPNMKTMNKDDLDLHTESYQFKIIDRSGISVRYSNWLALHQKSLSFAYYIHEDLRLPNSYPPIYAKHLDWVVDEVEPTVSWHNIVGHGAEKNASRTYKRFLFDLDLLQKEQNDPKYKDSAHTLFYLGFLHSALLEGTDGYKPPFLHPNFQLSNAMQIHLDLTLLYLKRFVSLHMDSMLTEYVYFSIRWLAYTYFFIMNKPNEAIIWYKQCIDFDNERADCKIELSKLYTFAKNDHLNAWKLANDAFLTKEARKEWTHSCIYEYSIPAQVSRAVFNIMSEKVNDDDHQNNNKWLYTALMHVR